MNSMKKTLTLLSFALLGVSFFAATKVEAKDAKNYVLEFTNAFKAIDGTYNVHIYFNKKYQVDFNFSIKNGAIGNITGKHADHVTLYPIIQMLTVELSSAIKWVPLQMSLKPPTITITGTAGDLNKSAFTINVANPWLKNATVDIFTIDRNATTKKITIGEWEMKESDFLNDVKMKEANVSQPINPPINLPIGGSREEIGLSREIEIAAPSK